MSCNLKLLNSGYDLTKWDAFVFNHPLGTIYHTSKWKRIIENVYGHRFIYLVLENDAGNIIAGLPLVLVKSKLIGVRLSSVPCAQSCNPLITSEIHLNIFLDYIRKVMREEQCKYYELKTSEDFKIRNPGLGEPLVKYSTYILDIKRTLETIKMSFHKGQTLRAINKSYRSGLELVVGSSTNDVRIFYNLYLRMRKTNGLLPQPLSFFASMWETLFNEGWIEILLAKHSGEIISSILLLKYKDTVIYEYGASKREMLRLHPSHFLLWEAIQRSKIQGYDKFDFGRVEKDNYGLSSFKEKWGTRHEVLPYYFMPERSGFAMMRSSSLANKIMCYSIKTLPAWVCRLMGSLLYKNLV